MYWVLLEGNSCLLLSDVICQPGYALGQTWRSGGMTTRVIVRPKEDIASINMREMNWRKLRDEA